MVELNPVSTSVIYPLKTACQVQLTILIRPESKVEVNYIHPVLPMELRNAYSPMLTTSFSALHERELNSVLINMFIIRIDVHPL